MKLSSFRLLADENIDPSVVDYLTQIGRDVITVAAVLPRGSADLAVLRTATKQQRVVNTHDRDFGTLAIAAKEPFIGILFLRPGHGDPQFTIDSLKAVFRYDPKVVEPFIVVAERAAGQVHIRIRQPIS